MYPDKAYVMLSPAMALSLDDSVGGRTLSWNVQFHLMVSMEQNIGALKLHGHQMGHHKAMTM